MNGRWTFLPLLPGDVGEGVRAAVVRHKGGVAYGLRVERPGVSLAYLPDHTVVDDAVDPDSLGVATGADVLIHDGQFVDAERAVALDFGHSTIEAVLRFADRAEVGEVIVTHHAPTRTDAQLRLLADRFAHTPGGRPVRFAVQGLVLAGAEVTEP